MQEAENAKSQAMQLMRDDDEEEEQPNEEQE